MKIARYRCEKEGDGSFSFAIAIEIEIPYFADVSGQGSKAIGDGLREGGDLKHQLSGTNPAPKAARLKGIVTYSMHAMGQSSVPIRHAK